MSKMHDIMIISAIVKVFKLAPLLLTYATTLSHNIKLNKYIFYLYNHGSP
jgi:hypothetical protein